MAKNSVLNRYRFKHIQSIKPIKPLVAPLAICIALYIGIDSDTTHCRNCICQNKKNYSK